MESLLEQEIDGFLIPEGPCNAPTRECKTLFGASLSENALSAQERCQACCSLGKIALVFAASSVS